MNIIDKNNIKVVRPSCELHPRYYEKLLATTNKRSTI